jgi:hypothetical protein
MRTGSVVRSRVPVGTIALAAIAAFAAVFLARSVGILSNPSPVPELANTGIVTSPISPEGEITRDRALDVIRTQYGAMFDGGRLEASLVAVTDPSTLESDDPIRDRPVWLLKYSGLNLPASAPMRADGTPAEAHALQVAYVYVDAMTGEWLFTRYSN